jgi:hypothetical protein
MIIRHLSVGQLPLTSTNQLVLSWLTLKTKVPATVMVNDPLKHKTLKKTNTCTCNCTA